MKIIHVSDVHLGASNRKLSLELQKILKTENAERLRRVFEYAENINADAIIVSGDLFHSKNPTNQHVKFFLDKVKQFGKNVFYVKGNHDEDFLFLGHEIPENLKIFGHDLECFELGEKVAIYGQSNLNLNLPKLASDRFNIMLLHGDIHAKGNDYIDLFECKNKNINYVALGHLHSYEFGKLDDRGVYAYSGCLTGNGFDECGEKGFILLDTDTGIVKFEVLAGRQFAICEADLTNFVSYDDLCDRIKNATRACDKEDFVRVILTGQYSDGQDKYINLLQNHFDISFAYFELIDKSRLKIDKEKLKGEVLSFKAEFLKIVSELQDISEEDKNTICEIGINALRGDDV